MKVPSEVSQQDGLLRNLESFVYIFVDKLIMQGCVVSKYVFSIFQIVEELETRKTVFKDLRVVRSNKGGMYRNITHPHDKQAPSPAVISHLLLYLPYSNLFVILILLVIDTNCNVFLIFLFSLVSGPTVIGLHCCGVPAFS